MGGNMLQVEYKQKTTNNSIISVAHASLRYIKVPTPFIKEAGLFNSIFNRAIYPGLS